MAVLLSVPSTVLELVCSTLSVTASYIECMTVAAGAAHFSIFFNEILHTPHGLLGQRMLVGYFTIKTYAGRDRSARRGCAPFKHHLTGTLNIVRVCYCFHKHCLYIEHVLMLHAQAYTSGNCMKEATALIQSWKVYWTARPLLTLLLTASDLSPIAQFGKRQCKSLQLGAVQSARIETSSPHGCIALDTNINQLLSFANRREWSPTGKQIFLRVAATLALLLSRT